MGEPFCAKRKQPLAIVEGGQKWGPLEVGQKICFRKQVIYNNCHVVEVRKTPRSLSRVPGRTDGAGTEKRCRDGQTVLGRTGSAGEHRQCRDGRTLPGRKDTAGTHRQCRDAQTVPERTNSGGTVSGVPLTLAKKSPASRRAGGGRKVGGLAKKSLFD